jgi:hemoglobin
MIDAYHILRLAVTQLNNGYEMHLSRVSGMSISDYAERARAKKMAEALACGIDDAFISQLVEHFYSAIRADALLGPIFTEKIKDWPLHLARMKDFWASIMLESGRYSANPMQKHIAISGIEAAHFERWHALWDQALIEIAPNAAVGERFLEAAQRIGESLLTGIQVNRGGLAAIQRRA